MKPRSNGTSPATATPPGKLVFAITVQVVLALLVRHSWVGITVPVKALKPPPSHCTNWLGAIAIGLYESLKEPGMMSQRPSEGARPDELVTASTHGRPSQTVLALRSTHGIVLGRGSHTPSAGGSSVPLLMLSLH